MKRKVWLVFVSLIATLSLLLGLAACGGSSEYEITFKGDDGTTLTTVTVAEGEIPSYEGSVPVKQSTEAHTYTFAGWKDADGIIHTGELPAAKADATYTAAFTQADRTYTVKWDVNGTVTSKVYKYGEAVSYEGDTPEKTADAQYTYTFSGWSDGEETYTELPAASKDVTYTAQFSSAINSYTVTWHVGETSSTTTVNYGEKAVYDKAEPNKTPTNDKTYTFTGWAKTENGDVLSENDMTVTGNLDLYAVFSEATRLYTVKFVDDDNSELSSTSLAYDAIPVYSGTTPSKARTQQYTYTFAGWEYDGATYSTSDTLPAVHGNMTFVAKYTSTVNKYTVTWNVDGDTSKTSQVEYGTVPVYDGTPAKADDAEFSYTFKGWAATAGGSKLESLPAVEDNVTYYALFEQVSRLFTVTWHIGEETKTTRVGKNCAPAYDEGEPEKDETPEFTYTFKGWSKTAEGETVTLSSETITEDTDYYAVFTATKRSYKVTFVVEGKETEKTLEYGTKPTYEGGDPSKEETVSTTYTFKGWSDGQQTYATEDLPVVTGEVTYTAVIEAKTRQYTITVKYYEGLEGTNKFNNMDDDTFTLDYGTILTADNTKAFAAQDKDGKHYVPDLFRLGGRVEGDKEYVIRYTEADKWDGTAKSESLSGTGDSAEDPFLISSAADLNYLSSESNNKNYALGKYYKLTKSIDLGGHDWTPICYANGSGTWTYFEGNFDGGGYTIAGMHCSKPNEKGIGLFAGVRNGEIKNLIIQGDLSANTRAGGLAYIANAMTVSNIKAFVDITMDVATGEVYSGGLFGTTSAGSSTYTDIEYYGTIHTTGKRVGGILGNVDANSTQVTLNNCTNYGNITSGTHSGGMIGEVDKKAILTNCVNYGEMLATTQRAGGIIATIKVAGSTITNCTNYGKISAPNLNTDTANGGICGLATGSTITGCTNYGEVDGPKNAGGICGSTVTVNVTECTNYGDIKGTMTVGDSNKGFAGIVGWTTTTSHVTKCTNHGNVEGNSNTGGICGYLGAGSKCPIEGENVNTNYGNVTGNSAKGNLIGFSNELTCPAG